MCAAVVALPAAAAARSKTPRAVPGFLVVRNASTETGRRLAVIAVKGFVLGHVKQEGRVQIYRLASSPGSLAAQAAGVDLGRRTVTWHTRGTTVLGTEFSGSDFRFRAVGGTWRVVVYGAGVSLYAGGKGVAHLHGSVFAPRTDGTYSFDGARFASLPSGVASASLASGVVTQSLGAK